ncbi:MAG: hypothetical protein ACRDZ1_09570 [Acidimicrobiia bacterium]
MASSEPSRIDAVIAAAQETARAGIEAAGRIARTAVDAGTEAARTGRRAFQSALSPEREPSEASGPADTPKDGAQSKPRVPGG